MSDPDDKPKAKIISLDERRRADAARQKAELAASVAAAKKARSNGSGAPQTYRQQMQGRAANTGGPPKLARGFGAVVAWVVWAGMAVALVLALIGTVMRG